LAGPVFAIVCARGTGKDTRYGRKSIDVNVLRRAARNGLDDGNFTLLDLSLGFWANGGRAEAWDLDAFIYGLMTLSGSEIFVLAWTLEELHNV